jgi:stress response protein YsnF
MGNSTPDRHLGDQELTLISEEPRKSDAWTGSEEVVPLVEEIAIIGKRSVVTGRLRVHMNTDVAEEIARAQVQRESVEFTRVPVDRIVEIAPEIRTEGDLTIVPVVEEVLVVEKRLVLKEELHIRRRVEAKAVEVPVTLRKQRAIVERLAPETLDPEGEISR